MIHSLLKYMANYALLMHDVVYIVPRSQSILIIMESREVTELSDILIS